MTGSAHITQACLPDAQDPTAQWDSVVCRRQNGPPLRFKGIHLTRHARALPGGEVSIDLWRRKTPGFVVTVTDVTGPDASSHTTIDAVMQWLEDRCALRHGATDATTLAAILDHTPRQIAAHNALRELAGAAMDAWDRLLVRPS